MKLNLKLFEESKKYIPYGVIETIVNKTSTRDRESIDWYLFSLAVKSGRKKDYDQMNFYVYKFWEEELKKLGVKSLYDEEV